jgi:hypothetical protein
MATIRSRRYPLILSLITLAACASGSGTSETTPPSTAVAPSGAAQIVVENLGVSANSFAILIEPSAGGVRKNLGTIDPNETKTFSYDAQPENYKLIAQGGAGETKSNEFRLSNTQKAVWTLANNRVAVMKK